VRSMLFALTFVLALFVFGGVAQAQETSGGYFTITLACKVGDDRERFRITNHSDETVTARVYSHYSDKTRVFEPGQTRYVFLSLGHAYPVAGVYPTDGSDVEGASTYSSREACG
jgi:hypothetical protein